MFQQIKEKLTENLEKKPQKKKPPKKPIEFGSKKIELFTINYKGTLQINKIHDTIKDWLEENKFEPHENSIDSEKDQKEIIISGNKIQNNFQMELEIYLKFFGNFNIAPTKNKKYPHLDQGKIEIIIEGETKLIEKDIYGDKIIFEKHNWYNIQNLSFIKKISLKIYNKLLDQDLENSKRELRKKAYQLHTEIKKTIGMTTL